MDDSSIRFVNDLKERLGEDATIRTAYCDEVAEVAADVLAIILTMQSGDLNQARDAAVAANRAVAVNPDVRLMLGLTDVNDDNREIDRIPAARATLCTLYRYLEQAAFFRFEVEMQAMMLVAAGRGKRVGNRFEVRADEINTL